MIDLAVYVFRHAEALHSSSADDVACLQFSKGFEKKDVPSGKGYIRLTPQPNVS